MRTRANGSAVVASAVAMSSLAGCTVGPNYAEPKSPAPPAWTVPLERGLSAEAAEVGAWWRVLADPALDGLIERSLAGNHDVRIAAARVREARAQRGVAGSLRSPTIDAGASYSRTRSSPNSRFGNFAAGSDTDGVDLYQAGFDASWEIDLFGHVRRTAEAAQADLEAATEGRREVLASLTAEVARNYVELRALQARVAIAEESARVQGDSAGLARARFEGGIASELDATRAEAQVAATKARLPALAEEIARTIHRLGVLVGEEPGALTAQLAATGPIPAAPATLAMGLPADLVRRRPDIRRAERELAAATARIGVATADLYPRLSLTGSFGLESTKFGTLPEGDSVFWSIGPSVRVPVFNAGRLRELVKVEDARADRALALLERAVLVGMEEAQNAAVAFAREQERRALLQEAVGSNERSTDLATQLYTQGLTDYLSVLDSQRELLEQRDQLVQSRAAVVQATIALSKAIGGGWEEAESRAEAR
ncbi:MAG: efflux transporter outer membrane subunit [Phycisphaerales bacterium]